MNAYAHIEALASQHNIMVLRTEGLDMLLAKAVPQRRVISVSVPTDEKAYWIALHEIGHIVCGHTGSGIVKDKEIEAWQWAIDHSKMPMTEISLGLITYALMTYNINDPWNRLTGFHVAKNMPLAGPKGKLP